MCPQCGGELTYLTCNQCQTEYFDLNGLPCLFPAGKQVEVFWQHQAYGIQQQRQASLALVDETLLRYDLLPATRKRIEISRSAIARSAEAIAQILSGAGLEAKCCEQLKGQHIDDFSEYYHHILRDWGWDEVSTEQHRADANEAGLKRVLSVWDEKVEPGLALVLGAGACRLSWDLHVALAPSCTIASDINPLLLACADRLIRRKEGVELPELYTYPQIGYPLEKTWQLNPPQHATQKQIDSWFALGADVWNMPIKPGSVDTLVTSWLIDVSGNDIRELMCVIRYLLKPGGKWLNTGPLLYSKRLPFDQHYSADEIKALLGLAGFKLEQEKVENIGHLVSPINARFHTEQVWTYCVTKVDLDYCLEPAQSEEWLTPNWLILHHLPIPAIQFECESTHEFVEQVLSLVDGKRSIYHLAKVLQLSMPPAVSAKNAIVALFGEILEAMAATSP
jgi:hypothetical protein